MTWPAFMALPGEALVTRRDVAMLFGCSERQVARLELPVVRLGTVKLARYAVGDVREYIEARRAGASVPLAASA